MFKALQQHLVLLMLQWWFQEELDHHPHQLKLFLNQGTVQQKRIVLIREHVFKLHANVIRHLKVLIVNLLMKFLKRQSLKLMILLIKLTI